MVHRSPGDIQAYGIALHAIVVGISHTHRVEVFAPNQLARYMGHRDVCRAGSKVVVDVVVELTDGQAAEAQVGREGDVCGAHEIRGHLIGEVVAASESLSLDGQAFLEVPQSLSLSTCPHDMSRRRAVGLPSYSKVLWGGNAREESEFFSEEGRQLDEGNSIEVGIPHRTRWGSNALDGVLWMGW